MSRPRFREYPSNQKKPPPEHGVKIKESGTTWWGKRWITALEEVLEGQAGRLARGRTYARAGRVHDLVIEEKMVTSVRVSARVTGTAAAPYRVTIALARLADEVWSLAVSGMARKAQFAAALLDGEMPEAIDEVFREAGGSLFPEERRQLATSCSCPDSGDPCKHVAATHYVLGEAFDRDPFLLFELRGRPRGEVLEALRRARTGKHEATVDEGTIATTAGTDLGNVSAAEYDLPREPLPSLQFSFDAPVAPGTLLGQLSAPPGWQDPRSPAEKLEPIIREAAEAARAVAFERKRRR